MPSSNAPQQPMRRSYINPGKLDHFNPGSEGIPHLRATALRHCQLAATAARRSARRGSAAARTPARAPTADRATARRRSRPRPARSATARRSTFRTARGSAAGSAATVGSAPEQRRIDSSPLRRSETSKDLVRKLVEQVAKTRERQRGVRLSRRRAQDPIAPRCARSTASRHSVVLPIPGGPTSAAPCRPVRGRRRAAARLAPAQRIAQTLPAREARPRPESANVTRLSTPARNCPPAAHKRAGFPIYRGAQTAYRGCRQSPSPATNQ